MELLTVHHEADLSCADEDGETALHLTLHRLNQPGGGVEDGVDHHYQQHLHHSRGDAPSAATVDSLPLSATGGASEESASGINDNTPVLDSIMLGLTEDCSTWLGVACLLVQRGASVTAVNSRRVSPLQSVSDLTVLQALQSYTVQDPSVPGALNNATRLDLDMKALDLAAESLRSAVLIDGHPNIAMDVYPASSAPGSSSGTSSLPPVIPPAPTVPLPALPPSVPPHRSSSSQPASPARFTSSSVCSAAGGATAAAVTASQPASPAHVSTQGVR